MNDDKPQEIQPSEPNDAEAAVPPPQQPGKWQMPKPVFKKTSGYLPQGFEKSAGFGQSSPTSASAPAAAPSTAPPSGEIQDAPVEPAAPVGEQPDFLDEFDTDPAFAPAAAAPPKRSSPAVRIAVAVLVFFVVAAFIAGFLYVIYILFLSDGRVSL